MGTSQLRRYVVAAICNLIMFVFSQELPPGSSSAGYTPLGALSSMHPPGGGAAPHLHQGKNINEGLCYVIVLVICDFTVFCKLKYPIVSLKAIFLLRYK